MNAAWFAAVSVVSKEWLFRITRTVAEQESSPVLLANAYHHRSDAYSSVVALIAILGSGLFPTLPLDPIGGACQPKTPIRSVPTAPGQALLSPSSSSDRASRYSRAPFGK